MSKTEIAPSPHRPDDVCGLYVDEGRRIVRFSGDRARAALNGLLTADLGPAGEGLAVYTFALSPKGRVLAEGRIFSVDDELWFDIAVPALEPTLEHLGRYLPPRFAKFTVDQTIARAILIGPRALATYAAWSGSEALANPVSARPGTTPMHFTSAGDGLVVAVAREAREGGGIDLFLAGSEAEVGAAQDGLHQACVGAGGGRVDRVAFDVWRLERGIPEYGREISSENLPQETGLDAAAISYDKGCYTGQEVVARIHYRGRVNRHLRGLRSAHAIPEAGRLFDGSRDVGLVTSATLSPRLGHVALGYVRREVEPRAVLALIAEGTPAVEVVELPFTLT